SFAAGYNFSPDSRLEFKGFRLYQHDVQFPGLFFDINRLDTESYGLRYTCDNQGIFDHFQTDLWYNDTTANGDTRRGAKQAFLTNFLGTAFTTDPAAPAVILDFSTSSFIEISRGYRSSVGWGKKDGPQLAVGTDLNYVTQRLNENIRLLPIANVDPSLG